MEDNNIPPASTAVSGSNKDGSVSAAAAGSNSADVIKNGPSKAWGKNTENGRLPLAREKGNNPFCAMFYATQAAMPGLCPTFAGKSKYIPGV